MLEQRNSSRKHNACKPSSSGLIHWLINVKAYNTSIAIDLIHKYLTVPLKD